MEFILSYTGRKKPATIKNPKLKKGYVFWPGQPVPVDEGDAGWLMSVNPGMFDLVVKVLKAEKQQVEAPVQESPVEEPVQENEQEPSLKRPLRMTKQELIDELKDNLIETDGNETRMQLIDMVRKIRGLATPNED
ncbi:MAG: hypothetical protein M0R06_00090 [Sphaerochaeta sp.]|jgi:hypothetical protein|nr:hypothetical protein [Sphaerochaeta sp.]